MVVCPACEEVQPQEGYPCFELIHDSSFDDNPTNCGAVVCAACLGSLHAKRGCEPFFPCPGCGVRIVGHYCWKKKLKVLRGKEVWSIQCEKQPAVYINEPTINEDPCRYFLDRSTKYKADHVMLSVQWCERKSGSVRSMAVAVPHNIPADNYSPDVQAKIVTLMSLLCHALFHPELIEDAGTEVELRTLDNIDQIALNDKSLVMQSIISLATGARLGDILPNGIDSNPFQRSSFLALWVAIQMMKRAKSTSPGLLQDAIAKHLAVYACPQDVRRALCKFRIAASAERTRLKDIENVNQKIVRGWNLERKRHWLIYILYDNLGFRMLGARAGCDQCTMILAVFISPDRLQNLGFYPPKDSPERPICRTRKRWEDIRKNFKPDDILPTNEDYTSFGVQILSHIEALMSVANRIPSVNDARMLLEEEQGRFIAGVEVPMSCGTKFRSRSMHQTSPEVEVFETEANEEDCADNDDVPLVDTCLQPTMYDRDDQKVEVDLPIRADLNKKETVGGLAVGALKLRDGILSSTPSVLNTDEAPSIVDCGIFSGGDGSPSNAFEVLRAQSPEKCQFVKNFSDADMHEVSW